MQRDNKFDELKSDEERSEESSVAGDSTVSFFVDDDAPVRVMPLRPPGDEILATGYPGVSGMSVRNLRNFLCFNSHHH